MLHRGALRLFSRTPALSLRCLRPWQSMSFVAPRLLSSDRPAPSSPAQVAAMARTTTGRTMRDELKELRTRGEFAVCLDPDLLAAKDADVFPRIKTTSLSTKQIVIADECTHASVTLVLLAFRKYADTQIQSWRQPFQVALQDTTQALNNRRTVVGQVYEVTVNESFATQALSGFVQRYLRATIDPKEHDFHVAFNDSLREPIEKILPMDQANRLYGYTFLLDPQARVRWRSAGAADERATKTFIDVTRRLLAEDSAKS